MESSLTEYGFWEFISSIIKPLSMHMFYKTWHCTAADMKAIIVTEQSDVSKRLCFSSEHLMLSQAALPTFYNSAW